MRGTLKSWTKLWFVLKPGLLLLYRSEKAQSRHWIGTIILSSCELIERPSKKDGFCFKLFHPMDQSIWASKGPEGESLGAVVQPLPTSHLIFRAPTNAAGKCFVICLFFFNVFAGEYFSIAYFFKNFFSSGKCWMDALELALRCSSLLTGHRNRNSSVLEENTVDGGNGTDYEHGNRFYQNDSDVEQHFKTDLEDNTSLTDGCDTTRPEVTTEGEEGSDEDVDEEEEEDSVIENGDLATPQTVYVQDAAEVFGTTSDQTEEFGEENKSVLWFLMKQVFSKS